MQGRKWAAQVSGHLTALGWQQSVAGVIVDRRFRPLCDFSFINVNPGHLMSQWLHMQACREDIMNGAIAIWSKASPPTFRAACQKISFHKFVALLQYVFAL